MLSATPSRSSCAHGGSHDERVVEQIFNLESIVTMIGRTFAIQSPTEGGET